MSSNKSAREELERIYGKHCMIHQGIRKLNPPKPHKGKYKGKSIALQLTYHHLRAKRNRRKSNSREWSDWFADGCHDWLEQLSNADREAVNNELREYKRRHSKECTVEFVDYLPLNWEVKAMVFTPEELQPKKKYNRAKDKREFMRRIEEYER